MMLYVNMRTYLELEPNPIPFIHIQSLHQLLPEPVHFFYIILSTYPKLDPIDFAPQTDHRATNLVALVELLADKRHGEPAPATIEQLRVIFHREDPFTSIGVRFVLPHWFDAGLEEVVVGVAFELGGRFEPVEVSAERLDRLKFADH